MVGQSEPQHAPGAPMQDGWWYVDGKHFVVGKAQKVEGVTRIRVSPDDNVVAIHHGAHILVTPLSKGLTEHKATASAEWFQWMNKIMVPSNVAKWTLPFEPYLLKVSSSKYTEIAGSALHRCIFVPYMTMVISYVLISIERVFGFYWWPLVPVF
jgi:hypothetical protein